MGLQLKDQKLFINQKKLSLKFKIVKKAVLDLMSPVNSVLRLNKVPGALQMDAGKNKIIRE